MGCRNRPAEVDRPDWCGSSPDFAGANRLQSRQDLEWYWALSSNEARRTARHEVAHGYSTPPPAPSHWRRHREGQRRVARASGGPCERPSPAQAPAVIQGGVDGVATVVEVGGPDDGRPPRSAKSATRARGGVVGISGRRWLSNTNTLRCISYSCGGYPPCSARGEPGTGSVLLASVIERFSARALPVVPVRAV